MRINIWHVLNKEFEECSWGHFSFSIICKNISSFVHYILPSGVLIEISKERKRQSERSPLRKTFVLRYTEPNVKRSPSSRIDAWTIRRLRELKNCYSRANGLILRQIASETFPPEISTRYLPLTLRTSSSILALLSAIWLTEFPSATLKTSNRASKGWKSSILRCSGGELRPQTTSQWTLTWKE